MIILSRREVIKRDEKKKEGMTLFLGEETGYNCLGKCEAGYAQVFF